MKTPTRPGRSIEDSIALARDYEIGYAPVPDPGFAKDVESAIASHREPLDTSAWD
jgi:hypothetical protein